MTYLFISLDKLIIIILIIYDIYKKKKLLNLVNDSMSKRTVSDA